ncbi:MAG: cbb3-type cytochrome oxidase assembly protein CcoS [Sphingobacteriales bacterium]|nr:MAG: cbb3-type cytochrome oxidase assembly protein CcoS [Sphingobacteriales bacterium]
MSAMFFLIIASIFVAAIFLIIFIWAVRSGQYDDSYTPSVRILFEDNKSASKTETPDQPE